MSMWLMYLILKLDDAIHILIPTTGILAVGLVIGAIVLMMSYIFNSGSFYCEDNQKNADKFLKNIFPKLLKLFKQIACIEVFLILLLIILPSTKQAAAIYFVPKVINNKQIQKMPSKLVKLANGWMDEQIKSIKKVGK